MEISKFISSLLPSFKRVSVLENLRITLGELKEHTMPAYKASVDVFKGWDIKSPEVQNQVTIFNRAVKGSRQPVVFINDKLKQVAENIEETIALVERVFNEDIASPGLTYQKANILQMANQLEFVVKYARKWLVYIYVKESALLQQPTDHKPMTQAEIDWIEQNFIPFTLAFSFATHTSTGIIDQIKNIPDVVVSSDNLSTVKATVGAAKLDPFGFGFISTSWNPFYLLGRHAAERQVERYRLAKEELRVIQLYKLNLEKLNKNSPDAKLQKEIEYTEQRIQDLAYKVHKMEEDYGQ